MALRPRLAFQARMLERRRARISRSFLREAPASLLHLVRFTAFVWTTATVPRRRGPWPGPQWVGVVLSYRRPLNIEPIVRAMLRCGGCQAVIVSNNDPTVDLQAHLVVTDPRLRVVQQQERRYAGIRLEMARQAPATRYLLVDDDMFLASGQLERLVERLDADPGPVHGVFGEVRDDARLGYPYRLDCGGEREVDHLTNVYAITGLHLQRCFGLLDQLGIDDACSVVNGEDLIMSASGTGRPRTHDVGWVLRCASTADTDIATCKSRDQFFEERLAMIDALHRVTGAALRPPAAEAG